MTTNRGEAAPGRRCGVRMLMHVAALLLLLSMPELVLANGAPTLRLSVLADQSGAMDLASVRQAAAEGHFQTLSPDRPANLGLTSATIWVLAEIDGATIDQAPWFLELSYASLDRVAAFVFADGRRQAAYRLGENAIADRPVAHRYPLVPLPSMGGRVEVYLSVRSQGSVLLPLKLLSGESLRRGSHASDVFYGAYFAALATMLLYNGFVWLAVRHRSYLYYVSYLASFGALLFHMNGYTFLWLPPVGLIANPLMLALLSLVEGLGMLFVMSFLDTRVLLPRLHRVATVVTALCLGAGVLGPFIPYALGFKLLLLLAAAVLIILPTMIGMALRAGQRTARFLVLSFLALAPGCLAQLLLSLGLLPETFVTEHLMEISTGLEMMLLSFALADRINVLQAEQRRVEQKLQQSARQHAEQLVRTLEEERRRVAGELHDSIGQNLLVIGNQLGRVRGNAAAAAFDRQLGEVADLARDTVQDVRAIAHRLYPQQLKRLGLRDALEATLTQAFAASETALHLSLPDKLPPVSAETGVHVFHIVQEAASNVLRHAAAANCWIDMAVEANLLSLSVADDGRGIALSTSAGGGIGLVGQRERAMILGGELAIAGRPEGGTMLRLTLPLPLGEPS